MAVFSGLAVGLAFYAADRGGLFQQMSAAAAQHLPPWALFLFHHVYWLILTYLLVALAELLASIGLLLRKEWARRLFIVFMVGAILWQLVNLGIQFTYSFGTDTIASMPANVPAGMVEGFDVYSTVMRVLSVVATVGFCVLYAWIIKRLLSPAIQAEFA